VIHSACNRVVDVAWLHVNIMSRQREEFGVGLEEGGKQIEFGTRFITDCSNK
jgi:hypothetical protein